MSAPGPFRVDLDRAVAQVGFSVNRDTVLRARAALLAEADRLRGELDRRWTRWPGVGLCGKDPVSHDAAAALTERTRSLIQGCYQYCTDLEHAAYALDTTARRYGYTDDEIAASFRGLG